MKLLKDFHAWVLGSTSRSLRASRADQVFVPVCNFQFLRSGFPPAYGTRVGAMRSKTLQDIISMLHPQVL